jgi:hypothetical protein
MTDFAVSCAGTYPGEHRICESGRHEENAGERQASHGINELAHGNLNGIGNVLGGVGKAVPGGLREAEHNGVHY